jgi:multicomponent Na+:H+ antiporter subunit A
MLLLSVYLFLRGHDEPGGGFIAALVAGIAVAFGWFAEGRTGGRVPVLRALKPEPLVAAGLLISVLVALVASAAGEAFFTPLHLYVGQVHLTSSLLFDVGIYLFVLGLVVAAIDRLGSAGPPPQRATVAERVPAGRTEGGEA